MATRGRLAVTAVSAKADRGPAPLEVRPAQPGRKRLKAAAGDATGRMAALLETGGDAGGALIGLDGDAAARRIWRYLNDEGLVGRR